MAARFFLVVAADGTVVSAHNFVSEARSARWEHGHAVAGRKIPCGCLVIEVAPICRKGKVSR